MARWELQLSGHFRTGLENNTCLDKARLGPSNAALVRQIADLAGDDLNRPVGAAHQSHEILGYDWRGSARAGSPLRIEL